ncbi:preprotein translocase subunit YajC [Bartonella sp. B17]
MFINDAYAQVAGGVSNGSSLVTFIPFILVFGIMYFFIIRPQRVQMKKRQEMLDAVRRGDTVITGGGIIGKVTKVYDESGELEIEIGDGMHVRVVHSTLADVRVKGRPISEKKSKSNTKIKEQKKSKAIVKEDVDASKEEKVLSKDDKS